MSEEQEKITEKEHLVEKKCMGLWGEFRLDSGLVRLRMQTNRLPVFSLLRSFCFPTTIQSGSVCASHPYSIQWGGWLKATHYRSAVSLHLTVEFYILLHRAVLMEETAPFLRKWDGYLRWKINFWFTRGSWDISKSNGRQSLHLSGSASVESARSLDLGDSTFKISVKTFLFDKVYS